MDENRANSVCTVALPVPADGLKMDKLQGEWTSMPERDFQLRLTAYPCGNQRTTSTHVSAYLEVFCTEEEWHSALDFTLVAETSPPCVKTATWSSGPIRYVANHTGARVDWGCHELMPVPRPDGDGSLSLRAYVALQEAYIEVVHLEDLGSHINEFGLCCFGYTRNNRRAHRSCCQCSCVAGRFVNSSTTRSELAHLAAQELGRPVSQLRRFGRSVEVDDKLACNLPEAPRHALGWSSDQDEDQLGVYGLLTKWSQGESCGGARQNAFRFLALGDQPHGQKISGDDGRVVTVFVKTFDTASPLRFRKSIQIPSSLMGSTGETRAMAVLQHADVRKICACSSSEQWAVVREGSPFDWGKLECEAISSTAAVKNAHREQRLLNDRGSIVEGDIVVICPVKALPALAAVYSTCYSRLIESFVELHRRELHQRGSVLLHEVCDVMEGLNVDVW
eukprot:CAMPEP_0178390730 /NCGR_PEP_ID=MMETSP0689_2-20121128/10796_1 /TAXON_ID=160604 /ORGANISM="Amphidinium massartii, Strain CS-259" /LENGTH=448 /DNA_ID=CAMNT_0020011247 /DNA_START=216 /DNA_END=1559 /DNA_ORIENTATION=+